MVAERHSPRNSAVFHRGNHVVQRLFDFQLSHAATIDDITVDDHKIRLLRIQGPLHQFNGATVGLLIVLSVVELDHLEGAVGPEGQRWLGGLGARRGRTGSTCCDGESERAQGTRCR